MENGNGALRLRAGREAVTLFWDGAGDTAELTLLTASGTLTARAAIADGKAQLPFPGVTLWNPEAPVLYEARARVLEYGKEIASCETKLGFGSVERQGSRLLWNGAPMKLRGVCYRERPGDPEGTRRDLARFAQANVNFLRSIYGSFSPALLSLCDEMGFFVEDTAPFWGVGTDKAAEQDLPHCREAFVSAAERLEREAGEHVCVLLWSLGHDCAWGMNFTAAAKALRALDPVRPITFHLPMSVPPEEWNLDVWPVQYVDWRLPFDKRYDQMVIFHTPGADNEIGYRTADAAVELPVLHEVWSPVACHNRDEILAEPGVRTFWGESIRRFADKAWETPGCLGGAVLAGVDEDGSFEGMTHYEWGILDGNHEPKPEYAAVREAYAPVRLMEQDGIVTLENRFLFTDLSACAVLADGQRLSVSGAPGSRVPLALPEDTAQIRVLAADGRELAALSRTPERTPDAFPVPNGPAPELLWDGEGLTVRSGDTVYRFSRETCLLTDGSAGGVRLLAGGPLMRCTNYTLGAWRGETLEAVRDGNDVLVTIEGAYGADLRVRFLLAVRPGGVLETGFEPLFVARHMPHAVKSDIGISSGGLNDRGVTYLLAPGALSASFDGEPIPMADACKAARYGAALVSASWEGGAGIDVLMRRRGCVRFEEAPEFTPGAIADDRDPRFVYTGAWSDVDDPTGDLCGTLRFARREGDCARLRFAGTGVRLFGPLDMNGGLCEVLVDGEKIALVSQYLEKVDFPGVSRGYEKRPRRLLAEVSGLPEGEHELTVRVLGKSVPGAQNTYTMIDYAVLEGSAYPRGVWLHADLECNFSRLVRGCVRRERVQLLPGDRDGFSLRLCAGEAKGGAK